MVSEQPKKSSGPGCCDDYPDRTGYRSRNQAEAVAEKLSASGMQYWVQMCPTCKHFHVLPLVKTR